MKLLVSLLVLLGTSNFALAKGTRVTSLNETFEECVRLANGHQRRPASIGDDLANILALQESAKEAALKAKQNAIAAAFAPDADWAFRKLCVGATTSSNKRFERAVKKLKKEFPSPVIQNLTNGEFAFFADCNGRNAFETNITTTNIRFDANGLTQLTIYMLDQLGPELLNEKGATGVTPLEFVEDAIKGAQQSGADDLAAAYGMIRQEILQRLGAFEHDKEVLASR